MKSIPIFMILAIALCGTQVFADINNSDRRILAIKGSARLYIPIDQFELEIYAGIVGENPEEIEEKGYQIGLNINRIFKDFGISESSIKYSRHKFEDVERHNYPDNHKGKKLFRFVISYEVLFKDIELIDSFRKECIKIGVTEFGISNLINNERQKNANKVKKMAYENAKKNAKAIIKGSGLSLGHPILINGHDNIRDQDEFSSGNEGLGPTINPYEKRASLLQQQKFYIEDTVEVKFTLKL